MIGEMLKQLDEDRFIVKASSGPRYVVGVRRKVRGRGARSTFCEFLTPPSRPSQLDKSKLLSGVRVALDITTLTIMRHLPREVDPTVYQMLHEDPGAVSFASVGGLHEQIRELREVIELPLTNPELFKRVGIKVRGKVGVLEGTLPSLLPSLLSRHPRVFSCMGPLARAKRS